MPESETREIARLIYEAHDGADCDFCGALCPDDAVRLIDAIDEALRERDERAVKIAETHSATGCDGPDCGVVIAAAIRRSDSAGGGKEDGSK
jgi:hypothetical protein